MEFLLIVLYVVSGVLAYAGTLAHFQRRFPALRSWQEVVLGALLGLFGPIGFLASLLCTGSFASGFQFIPEKAITWEEYFRQRRGGPWN